MSEEPNSLNVPLLRREGLLQSTLNPERRALVFADKALIPGVIRRFQTAPYKKGKTAPTMNVSLNPILGRKALTFAFSGFSFGGGLGGKYWIGVDYWFVDNISLSGEQSVSLEYTIFRDAKVFRIRNATSSVMLSVYF